MYNAAPKKMGDITAHMPQATIDGLSNAEETRVKDAIKFGLDTSKMFIQTQMFIAGLCEELRHRVMESGKSDPLEVFQFAQEMEQMKEKKHQKKPISIVKTVTVVTNDYENKDDVNLEALEDEELGMVNAIRFQ